MNPRRYPHAPVAPELAAWLRTLTVKQRENLGFRLSYPQGYITRAAEGDAVPSLLGWRLSFFDQNRHLLDSWPRFA